MLRYFIFSGFFLFSLFLNAQEKSLLWKVYGNGLEQESHLFGTIHLLPKGDYLWTDTMDAALKASDLLVMEIDLSELSLKDKLAMAQDVIIPDGKTLEDLMGPESYEAWVRLLVDSLDLRERKVRKRYQRIQPFYLQGLILNDYLGRVKMYEKELEKIAKRKKIPVTGLESVEFQMSLVKGLSMEDQLDMLSDITSIQEYFTMLDLYQKQDLNALEEFSLLSMTEANDGLFMMDFVEKRNRDWVPKIEELIRKQSCFIAVGALHLPGEVGVIQLLREQGYQVEPVLTRD